jgi:hypothetical protein
MQEGCRKEYFARVLSFSMFSRFNYADAQLHLTAHGGKTCELTLTSQAVSPFGGQR